MKKNYADFWLDGEKEAYIVRHNYGSNNFFLPEDAIKMERVIVDEATAERGYVVNTSQVDYEFGFALKKSRNRRVALRNRQGLRSRWFTTSTAFSSLVRTGTVSARRNPTLPTWSMFWARAERSVRTTT